jgi:hypothetical protein
LDGDGDGDIAYTNWGIHNITVLRNSGGGTFAPYVWYDAGDGPWDIADLDVDGDGDRDLAVTNTFGDAVSLLRNNGDATFAPRALVPTGLWPRAIGAADLDGDGDRDLATANQNGDSVSIVRNTAGALATTRTLAAGDEPRDLVVAQLDGVAGPDVAVIAYLSNRLTILAIRGT